MAENTNQQIAELNQKVDLLLEYVNEQRLKSVAVDDLISDISIVGKDIYDSTVNALDEREVEIDPNQLRELLIGFIKNIGNFNTMLETVASVSDLVKDVGPIANEVMIDATKKLHEIEQKGYFEFVSELGGVFDNIVLHYSAQDARLLADNIVVIMETIKNLTQPEMLQSLNNAVKVFSSIEVENIPEYSVWKLMREMNKPEMKKAIGFFMTFMKNISNNTNNQSN